MKEKVYKITSIISFILSMLLLAVYLIIFLLPRYNLNVSSIVVLLGLSVILFYLGNLFINKYHHISKPLKMTLYYILIIYILSLLNLTIFDYQRGFNFQFFFSNKELFHGYLDTSVKLIPFSTIIGYFRSLFNHNINVYIFVYNIIGNLICLIPYAILLPLLFPKQNKAKVFIPTIILLSIGIELLQLITLSGTLDIDDVILNSLGAIIIYFIIKTPSLKKLINHIFNFNTSKINKKDIKVYIITLVITIILASTLFLTFKYFQSKEYKGYSYNIIDKSTSCDNVKELFYEDDYYTYYFNCAKSDDVYIIFNNKDEYLLKDFLNNNPNPEYQLNNLNIILKNTNIGVIIEAKIPKFSFEYEGDDIYASYIIDNPEILELEHDIGIMGSTTFRQEYFIKAKKPGTTKVIFEVKDFNYLPETKIIDTVEYLFTVNNDLTVKYTKVS